MTRRITNSAKSVSNFYTDEQVNDRFMVMVPAIKKQVRWAFKGYNADKRAEAEQAIIVIAFDIHKKAVLNGRMEKSLASPLSRFAIGRYKEGRTGGAPSCSTDVTSEHCKALGRSSVRNYGLALNIADTFESEATVRDARYPVADAVQFKLDFFEGWLPQQSPRDQEIILDLAKGHTTGEVAKKHGVSDGLISQYRKRYAQSWDAFINPPEESA